MKKFWVVVVLIVAAAFYSIGAPAQGAQSGAATAASDVTRGQSLYNKYGCWECHGYTASTGNAAVLVLSSLNATGFTNYVRNPRTNGMPAYSAKAIPDPEMADIYAYVKSMKKPAEAKDIPLLQQILNEK